MIDVTVNGMARELSPRTTVAELVATMGGREDGRGVAVAIDGDVVPRSAWATTTFTDGDRVEVLVAVQGG